MKGRPKESSQPMAWANETRLARWRRRVAATVLGLMVLVGSVGGRISSSRANMLQSRLETGQIEYVAGND